MPETKSATPRRAPTDRKPAKPRAPRAQSKSKVVAPPGLKPEPDGMEVRPDGTVSWKIGNETYWLRRPTAGQYLALTEHMELLQDTVRVEQEQMLDTLAGLDKIKPMSAKLDAARALDAKSREFNKKARNGVKEWWTAVFAALEVKGRAFPVADAPVSIFGDGDHQRRVRDGWLLPSDPGAA